jgi:hypothetical protein
MSEATKIKISGRASYPKLAKPEKSQTGKDVYSLVIVLDPKADLKPLQKALVAALQEEFGEKATKMIRDKTITLVGGKGCPIRDDGPAGLRISARSYTRKPGVVTRVRDANGKPTVVPDDKIEEVIYPGCNVNVTVEAYYYTHEANKGLTWSLNNVQFAGDNERLDGRVAAQDEFETDDEGADLSDLEPAGSANEEDDLSDILK